MKIQTKLLIVVMLLSVICTTPAVILYYRSFAFDAKFGQIPGAIGNVAKSAELNSVAQYIRYYDEVLTQSARNYAFTGDVSWKNRYNTTVPLLDSKIKDAIDNGMPEDKTIFQSIDTTNQTLVVIELQSIKLVDQGRLIQAQTILNGTEYAKDKLIYQKGLEAYYTSQGKGYNDTLTVSTQIVNDSIAASKQNLAINGWITLLISFFCVAAGFTIYFFVRLFIFRPLEKVTKATEEIAKGNLSYQIGNNKNDEIGKLASSFDQMTRYLSQSNQNIEQKVAERTEQLEKLNKAMVGRELEMIKLKGELKKT